MEHSELNYSLAYTKRLNRQFEIFLSRFCVSYFAERLDQDTSGILTTICNHSFHCSCISKWADSSCPVSGSAASVFPCMHEKMMLYRACLRAIADWTVLCELLWGLGCRNKLNIFMFILNVNWDFLVCLIASVSFWIRLLVN